VDIYYDADFECPLKTFGDGSGTLTGGFGSSDTLEPAGNPCPKQSAAL